MIQEYVLGKQVILVYFIVNSGKDLFKKLGLLDVVFVIGIFIIIFSEVLIIVCDIVIKFGVVEIGFFDCFIGVVVLIGDVFVVEYVFRQVICIFGELMCFIVCLIIWI